MADARKHGMARIISRGMFFVGMAALFCPVLLTFAQEAAKPKTAVPDKLVVWTFDDAVLSHSTVVAPLLKNNGFGATFFVCEFTPGFEDKSKYMSWEQMAALAKDGFEVANHTRTHRNVGRLKPDEFKAELNFIEGRCEEFKIPRPVSFAYPAYQNNPAAVELLRKNGYSLARVGDNRAYDPLTDNPLLIPSFSTTGSDEKAYQRVIAALKLAKDGKIVVLTTHGVPDTAHPKVTTSPALFERYVRFLKENNYTVIPMRDLTKYIAKP